MCYRGESPVPCRRVERSDSVNMTVDYINVTERYVVTVGNVVRVI